MQTGYFAVFYIQKCLFLSFSRLNSPLCALRKINKPTIFALKKLGGIILNSFLETV